MAKVKSTKEQFIEKAINTHSDKYDYSKVNYIDSKTKVCIICHEKDENGIEHGEFWMLPFNHLKGQNCPKCYHNRGSYNRYTQNQINARKERFINSCKKRFNDNYDYSKVNYIDSKTKVCIICHEKDENGEEHGEFWITPHGHMDGHGCPKCKGKKIWDARGRITTKDFIKRAREIHGDKYDYSKVEYKTANEYIEIICKKCGKSFLQTPNKHLMGRGCPTCSYIERGLKHRLEQEDVVNRFRDTHKNTYNYSKVNYEGYDAKVCIICPIHGEFWQTPNKHIQGCGCPKCSQSKLEKEIMQFLESNEIVYINQKIFADLKFEKELKFDFYLPKYNIAIECQGQQHFKPVDFANKGNEWANEQFELNIKRDMLKRDYCFKNHIKLLYYSNLHIDYPYHVYEDLDELLAEIKENELNQKEIAELELFN